MNKLRKLTSNELHGIKGGRRFSCAEGNNASERNACLQSCSLGGCRTSGFDCICDDAPMR